MEAEEYIWIAEQRFRCVRPDGESFDVDVRLSQPVTVPVEEGEHPYSRCRIALEPLAKDRWGPGNNAFQALCLSLDYIRTVLKVFVGEGGHIYWEDTDSLVDLESSWFAPLPSAAQLGIILNSGNET